MSDEIKIITLGDIFKNIETEEKAFKFKDYITNLQTIEREYSNLLSENIELQEENDRLNNIIKDIKSQLDYLETYSSKEDVFEDMKRRLDRINNVIEKVE